MAKATTEDLFWLKVDRDGACGCWLWTAHIMKNGYGQFSYGRQKALAHRFAYELTNGPVPPGLHLDHSCRVRHCVNPAHLDAVTQAENNRRAAAVRQAKTHCDHGHEMTAENTVITQQNARVCRACRRETVRRCKARLKAALPPVPPKTHCMYGHPWTEDNIYVKNGRKHECRTCRREQFNAWRARNPRRAAVS